MQIRPNCTVAGVTHALDETGMTFREDVFEAVHLHEGVFVGANAVVGPGVEIETSSVVAAGATVTSDVAAGQIVLGSPPNRRSFRCQSGPKQRGDRCLQTCKRGRIYKRGQKLRE